MAARRRREENGIEALIILLRGLPWWCGPALAVLAFALVKWGIPILFAPGNTDNPILQTAVTVWLPVLDRFAPLAPALVLFAWAIAEFSKWRDRARLDQQSGPDSIRQLNWREFESLLAEAFRRQGYHVEELGGPQPDGGIDLRLHKSGKETLVQCKHWKQYKVGVNIVRELKGLMATRGAHGIIVTSGAFTREARHFADEAGVALIDGEALASLIQAVQRNPPPTKPSPAPAQPDTPACPKCGSAMILRTARRSEYKGAQFWGCTNYPQCRGIVHVG
ncbi:MAG: hypothetical protein RLZZ303_2508 [Candidatus Hydrogenedentota bacterium]